MKTSALTSALVCAVVLASSIPAEAQLVNRTDQFNVVLPQVGTSSTEVAVITLRNPNGHPSGSVAYNSFLTTLAANSNICTGALQTDRFTGFLVQTCPSPGPGMGSIGPMEFHQIVIRLSATAPTWFSLSYSGTNTGAHLQAEITIFDADPRTAASARILSHRPLARDDER